MTVKSEAVAQKKDNENLLHWLRVTYVVIFLLLLIYYGVYYPFCNNGFNPALFASGAIILLVIALIMKSPPLALLVIFIAGISFYLAPLCPAPSQCTFPAGISCVSSKISGVSGNLMLVISQDTGHTIVVTGMACTANLSSAWMSSHTAYWGGTPPYNITVPPGTPMQIANGTNVICTDSSGHPYNSTYYPSGVVGTQFDGRIYINYTEQDTGIWRIATGSFYPSGVVFEN